MPVQLLLEGQVRRCEERGRRVVVVLFHRDCAGPVDDTGTLSYLLTSLARCAVARLREKMVGPRTKRRHVGMASHGDENALVGTMEGREQFIRDPPVILGIGIKVGHNFAGLAHRASFVQLDRDNVKHVGSNRYAVAEKYYQSDDDPK